ncbi:charged multivesicular body 3 [Lecanosticta acicola]|uniref:Charged multivesicular body 3 n=1 Tax=Lecanosticta acicola TaxID=111012 RepID=A0AAI9ECV4_9PEZI|nr:charged multivesicular body 3 [Lecanosticta acicola]
MDNVRKFFYGPTPEEQKRKCTALMRQNTRKLDRDIQNLKQLESKTRSLILQASKRAQRNPSQAQQASQETRIFAKELIRVRKQAARLNTSKATLQSVGMQVNEAFAMKKIEGSIKNSTGIMKDVNTLVRLPELTGTMRELSQELVKAGIIEEMVGDSMPNNELLEGEDEEAETEVDKVLGEVLKDRVQTPGTQLPSEPLGPVEAQPEAGEEGLDSEEMLAQMRGRLEALKS